MPGATAPMPCGSTSSVYAARPPTPAAATGRGCPTARRGRPHRSRRRAREGLVEERNDIRRDLLVHEGAINASGIIAQRQIGKLREDGADQPTALGHVGEVPDGAHHLLGGRYLPREIGRVRQRVEDLVELRGIDDEGSTDR